MNTSIQKQLSSGNQSTLNTQALNEVSNMSQISKSGSKTPIPREQNQQQLNFNAMIPPKKSVMPKEQLKQSDDTARTNASTSYQKEIETLRLIEEQKAQDQKDKLEENLRLMKETIQQSKNSLFIGGSS